MARRVFSKIQGKLLREEKMNVTHAAIMTANILNYYDEAVQEAVIEWAEDKDILSFSIGDISVEDVMKDVGCSQFNALCILQLLTVNPNSFKQAILRWKIDEVL